jgi:hypothetical protein
VVALGNTSSTLTTTKFNAAGGTLFIPYNLSAATGVAGQVVSTNGNSGNTVVNFNNVGSGPIVLGPNTQVIKNTGGTGTLNATAGTGLPFGLVKVALVQDPAGNGNWDLQRTANTGAIGAPAGSVIAAIAGVESSFHQVASAFVASPQSQDPNKWTGGIWTREAAGQVTTKSTVTDSIGSPGMPLQVKTNFAAYQVGLDSGVLNLQSSMWNVHVGAMAGTVSANSSEQLGSGTTAKFDVPFAGFYGVATRGAFFSDVSVRHDWYHVNVTNSAANLVDADLGGSTNAVNGSLGYHVDLAMMTPGLFIEPSVGAGVSWTKFDNLQTNLGQQSLNISPGVIGFNTFLSELVRVGVRIGTSVTINNTVALQPFTTISAWRELSGAAQEQFSQTGSTTVDNLSLDRIGTFYQVDAGVGGQVLHTGLIGFARADVRFGQKIDGASFVGGARYTFGP